MSWPLSHEFNEAIQNPKVAFADPELRDGEPVVGAAGLPLPRSGNFADVYQVRGAGGRDWAVKCFTRPVAGLAERYARVSEALERANLPFNVGFKFLAEGIRVGGAWRPVVMMEWVEGLLLNQVAREAAGKPQTLGALGQMWAKLCRRLRKAGIAHADLQHGNVLMVPGNRAGAYGLKLIDYDGVWVPALANVPSGESGHPSFQHPARAATRTYSPDVDRFPHLVVAAALRGLAVGGAALWERYDNGDNLLFTEDDYKNPAESKLMRELWGLHDPAVQALVGRLAIACGQPIPQTPWLDRIAPEGEPVPLDEPTRLEAAAALGIALSVPVALPPEPGAEPIPELVPLPVPEEPPFTVVDEEYDYDDEDDENDDEHDHEYDPEPQKRTRSTFERPRTRGSKAHPKAKAGGGKVIVFAAIGAAAVVLVGALAAAVVLGGGRFKPDGTAQTPPKDAPPTAAEQGAPKAPHAGPQTDPEPEIPFTVPHSVPYPPAGGRYGLRLVWTTAEDLGGGLYPVCTLNSRLVAFPGVMGGDSRGAVLDAATGKRVAQSQARPAAGSFDRLQPLNDERFAVTAQHSLAPIPVVDARTGQTTELPYIPGPRRVTFEQVSPGAQYVALCVPPLAPDVGSFKLMRTSDERVLLDLPCPAVRAHFAADGTRVLLVERTGACRWFKLPSGRPDGQFDLPIATDKWQGGGLSAVSADGSVLVFSGSLHGHTGDAHILDGRTGRVRASIAQPHVTTHPSLSADGALLVVTSSSQGKTTVSVLRTDTAAVVAELEARPGATYCPAILPDGRGFVVRVHVPGERRSYAQRYDFAPAGALPPEATAGRERLKVDLNFQPQFARFSGDGQALTAHADKSKWFALIDARAGKVRIIPTTGDLRAYSFVPLARGRVGVFDEGTNVVRVLSAETGAQTDTINLPQFPAGYASSFRTIRPSPGGRFVAVGCLGGVRFNPETKRTDEIPGPVQVFDTRTGKTVVSTEWYGDVMHTGFAFSPDSSRVLVIDRRLRGRWYKLPSGEPDSEWVYGGGAGAPAGAAVSVARLSQDGRAVLCNGFAAGRPGAFTLDAATGALGTVFEGAYGIGELSADGTRARLAANKPGRHTSVVVNTSTGSEVGRVEIATGPDSAPNVELAPDGRALLHFDGSKRGPLVVYDLAGAADDPPAPAVGAGPKPRWTGTTQVTGQAVRLHADAESDLLLVAGSVGGLNAFKLRTGAAVKIDTGRAVAEFYDMTGGQVGVRPRTTMGELLILDAATGREIKKVPVPALPPESGSPRPTPALSPTGTHVAITHANLNAPGPMRVIDLATGKPVVQLDWAGGTAHFTADGRRVLLAERTGRCRWYKLPSGAADGEWAGPPDADSTRYQVTSISADGALVGFTVRSGSSGPNRGPVVLDGRTGKPVHRFGADYRLTSPVQLSADGRRAAVARRRDSVDVIDLRTGAVLVRAPIQAQTSAAPFALSRDGAVLVTVPEARAVHVFEVDASKPPAPAANENNSLGKAASPGPP
ncbi:translocation protein TolB [Gemmata obscuriglobus]|uniref:Protein kinase domain-containing protein n=1 Tax=Gemmata obscuriglobus TaxID=114 RepID=A0A2Z3GQH8_9BACT|nr:hypothetical protein [Gemmata obscuriglobus]AWM36559.1 hypothetical protein C1280_05650 [Gemmata obscuriglobus]QEG30815.1 translocation protein TolB [Gemmata obscuriglobus]VTS10146.1 serine threonine protein kinase : Uncharacterized protein OS=Thioploca ingrica GN=THII_1054 PE=4 SV=1 [Gemmata obscuriglobus UQM 2246]